MRVAALYDVHGNLPALEAVLAEAERESPDVVLVGGDTFAGPFPAECLELLLELGDRAVWIRGNADRELGDWPAEQLTEDQLRFLRGLDETIVLDVDEFGPVLFCHGSPRSDAETITERSPDARLEGALAGVQQQVVVHGHTHVAYDREWGLYRLICPGSVGMPYAAEPGAYDDDLARGCRASRPRPARPTCASPAPPNSGPARSCKREGGINPEKTRGRNFLCRGPRIGGLGEPPSADHMWVGSAWVSC
jgi:putative phosphoesterase